MAHSNGKIYRDTSVSPALGVDPIKDVAYITGNSTGDWARLCGDLDASGNDANKVNIHSVHKPVRSPLKGGAETDIKVPAKYGWQIDTKAAGSGTLSFIQMLRSQGANYSHWRWLKPRGTARNEEYRILDFEGYDHNQLPYRTPCFFSRLAAAELNISGTHEDIEMARRSSVIRNFNSTPFTLRDAYDVTVLLTVIDPNPQGAASYMNWDIDGIFDITLVDANGLVVDHDYESGFGIATGNIPQAISLHFESFHNLDGYTGPFHIEYRFNFSNDSYFDNGSGDEYIPVTVRIDTVYAATLTMSRKGQDGVVIRPAGMSSEWRDNGYLARNTIFGTNGHYLIAAVEVSNGSTTARKLALVPSSGFIPFKRIGITIQPREETDAKDVIVYLLYGNYMQIFPNFQQQVDYGELSLADSYVLTSAPNCYNELGIIPQEPLPLIVYQDDCQGATIGYTNGTRQTGLDPAAYGFTTRDYLVNYFKLSWGIGIDNLTVPLPVVARLDLCDGDGDIVASRTVELVASGTCWNEVLEFEFNPLAGSYAPFELFARLTVEVNGELYYIRFYPQALTTTDPGLYQLGRE